MSIQTAFQKCFGFFGEKPIVVEPSVGELTSDAGLLPICEFDERIGLTQAIAEALDDPLVVRVAVNQELVDFDQPVASGDEIAVFPPMTGG